MSENPSLALLVEGLLDEEVGRRLASLAGFDVPVVYGKGGVGYIQEKISGFNSAAASIPFLVLVDFMDVRRAECPPALVAKWLPRRHRQMLLRFVVLEIESWLLADPKNLAAFLDVAIEKMPQRPEEVENPKQELVGLARKSRSSRVKRLLVPKTGSTAREGPGYTSEMRRFVRDSWSPEIAQANAPSLMRCLNALQNLRSNLTPP